MGYCISGNANKISGLAGTLSLETGMIWYKENHPLLLKCFKTLLNYLYIKGTVYEGISLPLILMCQTGFD